MVKKIMVAAAMRSAHWENLALDAKKMETAGVDTLHFDVTDGHFTKDISGSPEAIAAVKKISRIPIEVHFMVERPKQAYPKYLESGADIIIVHVEAVSDMKSLIDEIKSADKLAGIALNPETPFGAISDILSSTDKVSVMTTVPGVGGTFLESVLPKLREIADFIKKEKLKTILQADGGVSLKTRDALISSGVTSFVLGYPLFSREDYSQGVREIKTGMA